MVFEKNAKNEIKYLLYIIIFYFFVIFSKSFKQNELKSMESCVLDLKQPNSAKMILINFFGPKTSRLPYYTKDKNSWKKCLFLQIL